MMEAQQSNKNKKNKKKWLVPGGVALLAGALGFGAGVTQQPEPEVETVVETETVTETVTEEVEVEVVSQACLDALDYADAIMRHAGDGFEAAAQGFDAAARFHVGDLELATADMSAAAEKIEQDGVHYVSYREDCKANG